MGMGRTGQTSERPADSPGPQGGVAKARAFVKKAGTGPGGRDLLVVSPSDSQAGAGAGQEFVHRRRALTWLIPLRHRAS